MHDTQQPLIQPALKHEPLAARMRPRSLDEFYGQQHILKAGGALSLAIASGKPPSLIFWGPPGTGKTTLAKIIAAQTSMSFSTLSAVTDGVKDIRLVVAQAKAAASNEQRSLLFIDEIHRFNKAQQDALLPHVECGLFTLIGATTENPSFELNNALLSRVQVVRLEWLESADLYEILYRATRDCERGIGELNIQITKDQLKHLAELSGGDARTALATLESLAHMAVQQTAKVVTDQLIYEVLQQRQVYFDKGGDQFYEQISALHKSVRGSAPDAALYWLARMLAGGCDPLYIGRRLVRIASEDIGLADPRALRVALDGYEMQERLGSPEGELGLAQVAVYLASAAKSNALYRAFGGAQKLVEDYGHESVPIHLRNAPTRFMKDQGYGADYLYAHDYSDGYAAGESYMPECLADSELYRPTNRGLELKIAEKLEKLRSLDNKSSFKRYAKPAETS